MGLWFFPFCALSDTSFEKFHCKGAGWGICVFLCVMILSLVLTQHSLCFLSVFFSIVHWGWVCCLFNAVWWTWLFFLKWVLYLFPIIMIMTLRKSCSSAESMPILFKWSKSGSWSINLIKCYLVGWKGNEGIIAYHDWISFSFHYILWDSITDKKKVHFGEKGGKNILWMMEFSFSISYQVHNH